MTNRVMMLKVFLIVVILSMGRSGTFRRSRRSVITDGGHLGGKCEGTLKLVTKTETKAFNMSLARLMVKNIARVVVEGSCCGTIYSRINFRGKSQSIKRPGNFLTRVRKAQSVVLRNC